jgi:hypothetical protein
MKKLVSLLAMTALLNIRAFAEPGNLVPVVFSDELLASEEIQGPNAEELIRRYLFQFTGQTLDQITFQTAKPPGPAYYQLGWRQFLVTTMEGDTFIIRTKTLANDMASVLDPLWSFFRRENAVPAEPAPAFDQLTRVTPAKLEYGHIKRDTSAERLIRNEFLRYTGQTVSAIRFQTSKEAGMTFYQTGWRRFLVTTEEGERFVVRTRTLPNDIASELDPRWSFFKMPAECAKPLRRRKG